MSFLDFFKGFVVTGKLPFKPKVTTLYPEQKRPKPERFAHVSKVGDVAVLVLRQTFPKKGEVIDSYTLDCFPSDLGGRGLELTKLDGTHYHVELQSKASTCTCKGFESHGWHIDKATGEVVACKHIMSLLALEAQGKL